VSRLGFGEETGRRGFRLFPAAAPWSTLDTTKGHHVTGIGVPTAHHGRVWTIVSMAAGAVVGFTAAYLLYLWLNPILEDRRDWLREMQGFLFTVIPIATVVGGAVGVWLGRRLGRS
jgi:hypothetical protein